MEKKIIDDKKIINNKNFQIMIMMIDDNMQTKIM